MTLTTTVGFWDWLRSAVAKLFEPLDPETDADYGISGAAPEERPTPPTE